MIGFISRRFLHTCQVNLMSSSPLAKLRKSTGYSVSNCRKALDMFVNDIGKAEEWLHAEARQQGWQKWAKVQSRSATQGLVGVFSTQNVGVMVEVNCETDFVSKNIEFHQLLENIIAGCLDHIHQLPLSDDMMKLMLSGGELSQLRFNSTPLADLVNAAMCKFNEKTVLKRGVLVKANEGYNVCTVAHPGVHCPNLSGATLGKYGSLIVYKSESSDMEKDKDLSLNICRHIIGMNPAFIGELSEQDILNFSHEKAELIDKIEEETGTTADKTGDIDRIEETNTTDETDQTESETDMKSEVELKTEEQKLLFQPYLLDPQMSVGEVLHNSHIHILDFERMECGQEQEQEAAVHSHG